MRYFIYFLAICCSCIAYASILNKPIIIIGGGPSGLLSAVMLARKGYNSIKVYEKLPQTPGSDSKIWSDFTTSSDRLYLIGINGRGQKALGDYNILNRIQKYTSSVLGRCDWNPDTPINNPRKTIFTEKTYTTKCIQRDRITSVIYEEILEKYSHQIKVENEISFKDVIFKENNECDVILSKNNIDRIETCNFLIGADGINSKVREKIIDNKKIKLFQYKDTNKRIYRTIPMYVPGNKEWRNDVNYSARTKDDINLDALPSLEGVYIGVLLYRLYDNRIKAIKTKEDAKDFFSKYLPQFVSFLKDDDLERFAKKNDSNLPIFSYTGPNIYHKNAILLGDAIHSVKPYFGMGVNSAFEDVGYLDRAFNSTNDFLEVGKEFSKLRANDAKALVKISHSLDGGFLTFILPLIIDSILHKKFPNIFSPNMIASLQNQTKTFSNILKRKQIDRVLQMFLFSSIIVTMKILFQKFVTICFFNKYV